MKVLRINDKDFKLMVYFLFIIFTVVFLYLPIKYGVNFNTLAASSTWIALLSIILVMHQREIQKVEEYEVYLRNHFLEIGKNIQFHDYHGNEVYGYSALLNALFEINRGNPLDGGDKGFGLSVNFINALVIHASELIQHYKNNIDVLSKKQLLFFHTHYMIIEKLKELMETLERKDNSKYHQIRWDKVYPLVLDIHKYKESL